MIQMPDFEKAWDYENGFYLTCDLTRISKFIAHYELFKRVQDLPGAIVECGVFKGASLARFAMFRSLFGNPYGKKIVGFDIFGRFPETKYQDDIAVRKKFVDDAGAESISKEQLETVLKKKNLFSHVELVEGDITRTVPEYVLRHPELKISLLNLDTDIYEPACTILEQLYPRIVPGGILILDDYGTFPGETKAADDFFKDKKVKIQKFPYAMTPCFIQKE
ncbi:MAG: class I SAM-dependent methyltransferase [Deltaproteobacteria bacterium]|nr:class I SAM-dependent methyltransferase [Deltaproteobacteria bacterium]